MSYDTDSNIGIKATGLNQDDGCVSPTFHALCFLLKVWREYRVKTRFIQLSIRA